MSSLLLDAFHQGKLDIFLSATESSPEPACAEEHKVKAQRTGPSAQGRSQSGAAQTDRHDRGSNGKESHNLQQHQQGSKPTRVGKRKVEDQKTSERHNKESGSKKSCKLQQDQQGFGPVKKPNKGNSPTFLRAKKDNPEPIEESGKKNCPTHLKIVRDSSKPVKKPDKEPDGKGSIQRPGWMKDVLDDFGDFIRQKNMSGPSKQSD